MENNNKNIDKIKNNENTLLENSLTSINKSFSIGFDILTSLDEQTNKLELTNDILESDEYVLNKALKTIRNMSWSGMFWNLLYSEPIEIYDNRTKSNNTTNNNTTKSNDLTDMNSSNKKMLLENTINKNIIKNKSKQDEYLEQISLKLEELHNVSVKIGLNLQEQNNLIDQIDANTELVTNKMLKVDLETKKLTNTYKNLDYRIMGKFNFVDLDSGLVLSSDFDGTLMLTNKIDLSTIFICYTTVNNIYGIQNYKTQKYLRTDFFGNIGFTGNYIGVYEQCFLHLDLVEMSDQQIYNPTGIIILSKNNYHGGWLKKPDENTNTNKNPNINKTTSNITDIIDMIIFQPIKLDN